MYADKNMLYKKIIIQKTYRGDVFETGHSAEVTLFPHARGIY